MIRSLVVTTWFPDPANPSRTPFCLAHVHALQDADVDVEVVHVRLGADTHRTVDAYEGVPTTRVSLRLRSPRSWLHTWATIHKKLGTADLVHTMAFSSVLVSAVPWLLRRRPWVHTEHWNGVIEPGSVSALWQRLSGLRHLLRLPHAVTGVTQELTDAMASFTRPGATHVVPCVVEPPAVIAPFPPREPLRIVGVGLLNERKGPLTAIDTIAWLVGSGLDVTYRWVGEGPLRAAAEQRVLEAGLSDRVVFSGAVPPSEVPVAVAAAHLFFVPSSQENFFTAAAEAIVAGRPVVVPRSGGFVEYCTPANSVVVDTREPRGFGAALLTAAGRLGETTPEAVSATIGQRFSRQGVGRMFRTVYRELCR